MGTRNLTIVISGGKTKVAQYGQYDGHPKRMGVMALEFLRECDLKKFKEKVDALSFMTEDECDEIDSDPKGEEKFPYLDRNTGAQILGAIYHGRMIVYDGPGLQKKEIKVSVSKLVNSGDFVKDSLFCEWAYLIDLDNGTFEVYKGFNTKPLAQKQRFKHLEQPVSRKVLTEKDKKARLTKEEEYFPIRMVKSYRLGKLPSVGDFLYDFATKEERNETDSLRKKMKELGLKHE